MLIFFDQPYCTPEDLHKECPKLVHVLSLIFSPREKIHWFAWCTTQTLDCSRQSSRSRDAQSQIPIKAQVQVLTQTLNLETRQRLRTLITDSVHPTNLTARMCNRPDLPNLQGHQRKNLHLSTGASSSGGPSHSLLEPDPSSTDSHEGCLDSWP